MLTGMRENAKKRETLGIGRLRGNENPGVKGKWIKEGEWAISLGVPIGNDLDHEKWWTHGATQELRFIQGPSFAAPWGAP